MSSVGPERGPLPDESGKRDRRILRFELITDPPAEQNQPDGRSLGPARTSCGVHWRLLASRDAWLCLAERALGDWATTLRAALLMLVAFAGAIVLIGVMCGLGGLLLGALLGLVLWILMVKAPGLTATDPPSR